MSLTMIEDSEAATAVWEKWKRALLGRRQAVLRLPMVLDVGGARYGFRLFENQQGLHCELFPWDIYAAAVQINKPNGRSHGVSIGVQSGPPIGAQKGPPGDRAVH